VHTAYVFSRSGRVVLAEGLFREALRRLHASVDVVDGAPAADATDAHPSTVALASWRFSQLLSVMPKREGEAQRWAELAAGEWARGGVLGEIDDALGSRDALSGKGHHGTLVVSNLILGRLLPSGEARQ